MSGAAAAAVGVGVEWPSGCGYRLPGWGAAAAPFDPLKSGVERVKMPPAELGRDRAAAAAYFSPGLYLGREPLPASTPLRESSETQDKRGPGESADVGQTWGRQRLRTGVSAGSRKTETISVSTGSQGNGSNFCQCNAT